MCCAQEEELCSYAEQFQELDDSERCKMVLLMREQPTEACRHGMANGMKMVTPSKYRRDLMCECKHVKTAKPSHRLRDCNGWFNPVRHCECSDGPPYKIKKICRTCNPAAFCKAHGKKQCHRCFPDKFQSAVLYKLKRDFKRDSTALDDAVQTLVDMKQ